MYGLSEAEKWATKIGGGGNEKTKGRKRKSEVSPRSAFPVLGLRHLTLSKRNVEIGVREHQHFSHRDYGRGVVDESVRAAQSNDFREVKLQVQGTSEACATEVITWIGLMDGCGSDLPFFAETMAITGREMEADVAVVAVRRAKGVAREVFPVLGFIKKRSSEEHQAVLSINRPITRLYTGRYFANQAACACPLSFDVGIDLKRRPQEIAVLGMQITLVYGDLAAIGGEFKAAHEVDHVATREQDVEVREDLEFKQILMLGLEVDHGRECALDRLAAVDLHRHVFREEHLGLQGEGDGQEEEGEEEGAASQQVAGRCRFHKEGVLRVMKLPQRSHINRNQ